MGELVTGDGVGEASRDLSLHLRLSFACEPRTRMSRNSSLESQAFVMRATTGNRLLSKSGLSEAELILSRAGHFDLTKDQVEQMVICPQHRHKLGKFWRPPRSCQYPSHSRPRKKHCNERHVIGLETAKNIQSVFKDTVSIGSRKN